ncbi:hypothetical protein GEMRC1_006179 [Eukaryota sp. GEM-RC1]
MTSTPHLLPLSVSLHSWNGDFSKIAFVATGSSDVSIYEVTFSKPTNAVFMYNQSLSVHAQTIIGLDWCGVTNRIVTCSEDCSVRVWHFNETSKSWMEKIVHTTTRAVLSLHWSPDGQHIALGHGQKAVSVCYFDESNQFWTDANSSIKKPHKSAVTSVAWSPNNQLVASGCTDCHVRVFNPSAKKVMADVIIPSWVDSLSFITNNEIVFSCHNSTLHFVTIEPYTHEVLTLKGLPESCIQVVSQDVIVAGGYDRNPHLYKRSDDGTWSFYSALDQPKSKATSALSKLTASFEQVDVSGSAKKPDYSLNTIHQNTITCMSLIKGRVQKETSKDDVVSETLVTDTVLCTTSSDGKMVLWKLEL